jgi:PAS domain S-box-containing protein
MKKKTVSADNPRRKKAAPRTRPQKAKPKGKKNRPKAVPRARKPKAEPKAKTGKSHIPPSTKQLWDDDQAFRVLVKNSTDIFALVDARGNILYRSPTIRRMIRLSDADVVRTNFMDWMHPEDAKEAKRVFSLIRKSPEISIPIAFRIRDEAGRAHWVEGVGTNYLENPDVGAILINYRDVTKRKQQELVLQENERQYRELFEHAALAIFQATFDGKIIRVNPEFARMFGYASPEEVAASVQDIATELFADPELCGKVTRLHKDIAELSHLESRCRRKDGGEFWGLLNIRSITDGAGRALYCQGFIEDISSWKRADQARRESEEKADAMMAAAPYGIVFVDAEGVVTYANLAAERILGLRRSEIAGRTYDDPQWQIAAVDGGPFPSGELAFERVMATRQAVYNVEHAINGKDGQRVLISVSGAPLVSPDGSFSGMVATIQDITERKRAESALLESEERYRNLFAHSIEGIVLVKEDRIVDANSTSLDIFGYRDIGEIQTIPLENHLSPETVKAIERWIAAPGEKRPRPELLIGKGFRKDGASIDLELSIDNILIAGSDYYLIALRDITKRKRAEEELRSLALRHEALLAAIPEIVMEVNNEKIYTWANPAGIEFFGEDVLGKEASSYFEGEQDTYAVVEPLFQGDGETVYVESWQRRKDGIRRLLAWWCRPLKDERGEMTGALSSARDITEQRLAQAQIQILSRFPMENPNPVMRFDPDGKLLYANNASQPFLDRWKIEVGQVLPEECRALVIEAYAAGEIREMEMSNYGRVYNCTLSPIRSEGYLNVYGRDITERKQALEALQQQTGELRQRNEDLARLNKRSERQMRRLVSMRAIDVAITSSFKLELVLNILLGQLGDLLNVHAADILIFQPELQTFRFVSGRGFSNVTPQQAFLRKSESYANQAAQERRTIRVAQLDERADAGKIYPRIAGEGFVSYICLPLLAKGLVKGVLELFHRTEFRLDPEDETFLEMVAGQAAIAIENAEMFEGLQATNDELTLAYNDTLTGWARTLELREREMEGESQRLADLAVQLAHALGASEHEKMLIYRGAILHDIGMMGIADGILHKSGPLTETEWTVMRKHPLFAYNLLSPINYLRSALDIPYCHHEKWDGSGYPRGLKEAQIPFPARVFAVVDVWDAMRSDRPYRKAWKDAKAREYIREQSGKHFDPAVAQAFLEMIPAP